jgi:deoxyribose-phosphate aldolase
MSEFADPKIAGCVEATLFAPGATRKEIEALCAEAKQNGYRAVCVNGSRVELARTILDDTEVQVVALVGFPWGASDPDAKRYETEIAVDQGAHEIDCVINHGWLKDGHHKQVLRELRDIVEAAEERPVKAVIELDLLDEDERVSLCQLILDSGVQFVSLGTGFGSDVATAQDVKFFKEALGETVGVKVTVNSSELEPVQELLNAGAGRIGFL